MHRLWLEDIHPPAAIDRYEVTVGGLGGLLSGHKKRPTPSILLARRAIVRAEEYVRLRSNVASIVHALWQVT
jgi:hypothetical protein